MTELEMTEVEQDRREFIEHCQEIISENDSATWSDLYRWLDQAMEGILELDAPMKDYQPINRIW